MEIKLSDKTSDILRNAPPLCIINGNMKALSSTQYPDYRLGKHYRELTNAQFLDHICAISWYLQWVRQINTDDVCANEISLTHSDNIDEPATENVRDQL